jgi:hypothetical protein
MVETTTQVGSYHNKFLKRTSSSNHILYYSWWQAIDEAKKKAEEESNKAKPAPDWWKDTSYNGKVFLPLSTAMDKVRSLFTGVRLLLLFLTMTQLPCNP